MRTEPLFDPGAPLPRGPHSLPREQVAASQRIRLLAAVTELVAEQGYAAVTMGALATRAGVARGAFYTHFANKEACFLAAYEHFAQALIDAVLAGLEPEVPWPAFVEAALDGYLGTLDREPAAARAFLIELEAAGAALRTRRRETMHAFARLLADRHAALRADDPQLGPLPERAYLGFVLGVRELVRETLEGDPDAQVRHLRDDILAWITAMVAGARRDG